MNLTLFGDKKMYIIIALIVLVIILVIIGYINTTTIKVNKVTVGIENLPEEFEGYKILYFTDLHSAEFGENNNKLVKKINESKCDIIIFGGDMVDSLRNYDTKPFKNILDGIDKKIYYVEGNHDHNDLEFTSYIDNEERVIPLDNKSYKIYIGDKYIILTGYFKEKEQMLNVEKDGGVVIPVTHYPTMAINNNRHNTDNRFGKYLPHGDLYLAGHYHNGQIAFPFYGAIVVPGDYGWEFFPKYRQGLYDLADGSKLYLSSGLGTTVLPLRLFSQASIEEITLRRN